MKAKGDVQKLKKCHFYGKVGHFKNECQGMVREERYTLCFCML